MTDEVPPKVENAPGLKWRRRKGYWTAFWSCRADLAKRGFRPRVIPLFRGTELTDEDRSYISDCCNRIQDEMLVWGRGGLPQEGTYDGTIASLILCFKTDADSSFKKNRYRTRQHYTILMNRIEKDHGDERIEDLRGRDMLRWHEAWAAGGKITMAHTLMKMVRGLFSYGMTLLECEHCTRMSTVMAKQRFEMGKPRTERLTAEMAIAIRKQAHADGLPSIALAQAIQFECMFRQKDVLGEWVPEGEPGLSAVMHDKQKWLWGIRWNEIDADLKLKHVTSKRRKEIVVDLRLAPMVLEEFRATFGLTGLDRSKLPADGPVIVSERTGRPWNAFYFRELWRKIARKCDIPDTVRSMDSRAGAISEATDAGADLESVRHAATHSDIAMTQRYSRGSEGKTAEVLKLRTAHRNRK